MNITEKILARHAHLKKVSPGEFLEAEVDLILANDVTGPLAIEEFEKAGARKVFNPDKVVFVPDHFTPCKDIRSAELVKRLRQFSRQHRVQFYEIGKAGIEHALLPEQGLVWPGHLIIGADSHTCTYGALGAFSTGVGSTDVACAMVSGRVWLKVPSCLKIIFTGNRQKWVGGKDLILYTIARIGVDGARYQTMELTGPVISCLPVDDRFTMCNMVIEAGAKNGIIIPDKITEAYLREIDPERKIDLEEWTANTEDSQDRVMRIDTSQIEPQVAEPPLPGNSKSVYQYSDVRIDQVVIGSCTNGRISDLRQAASIFRFGSVHPEVRTIIIPATQKIYRQALAEGLIDIFLQAGCVISPPTCGPCLGGHMGVLGEDEVAIATTNRNFIGRMGHPKSRVYLSNPAVAAASAIKGKIAHPEEVLK